MNPDLEELRTVHRAALEWSRTVALPLWGGVGFDASTGHFEEQLDFDRKVVTTVPRRAMVQARQIVVFASAALDGWYPAGADLARFACDRLIERFWAADGKPGFVFSLARDGSVADGRRDLYAHAFILFALAWRHRLGASEDVDKAIEQTLTFVTEAFAAADGEGYVCTLPRPDALRRQNPHMHLFEAAVELLEATGSDSARTLAASIRALAIRRFIRPDTGALLEYFTDDWRVDEHRNAPERAEPGHQMEWAWLLRRHEAIAGLPDDGQAAKLIAFALRAGIDRGTGRVIDEVDGSGAPTKISSRSWPHTETVKAMAREIIATGVDAELPLLIAVYRRLMTAYCVPTLKGGWIDQRDATDAPASKIMPASTLYHVHLAIREVDLLLNKADLG